MRKKIQLNNNWNYISKYESGMEYKDELEVYDIVNLPHANIEIPYNYFDEKMFQFVSCYQLKLQVNKAYKDKVSVIRFEGVMAYAKVFLNGKYLGEHKGGYTPFEFNVTKNLDFNNENILMVIVDSTEKEDIPPFGGQIDYLTYGGIYREVSLTFYDKVYIDKAKIKTENIYEEDKRLEIDLYTKNFDEEILNSEINIQIIDKDQNIIHEVNKNIIIEKNENLNKIKVENIKGISLWGINQPNLYEINITIKSDDYLDAYKTKIGFRECEFRNNGFYLNNEKIKIVGLNRHQSFPYNGYAMPRRVQEKDAEILKNELHVNLVRTSHYPQSVHFLNRCDELGLLVFEEIPGWQHIGNEEWKKVAIKNVEEMIVRDWNHPSIILWGVRINESMDDDLFYSKTNEKARELDKTRQTGGVRYIENSNLLEDVYTMNDFIHEGREIALRNQQDVTGLVREVPYLVTEYNGHMYPTKRFDQEERQVEHVLRHLKVQNASFAMDNISGAIGWCAFDYNTHKDFGSGDRICYHGVMDMFRINKFAAYVYKSQVSPSREAVLQPITFWGRGERSIGGILPLVVLTNCDYVEFQFGNKGMKKIYPAKDKFGSLPYPPIILDETNISAAEIGEWGMTWEDCNLRGYVKDEKVIEKKLAKDPLPTHLKVEVDDLTLCKEEKDATRVVITATDQYDNIMPFLNEIIHIKIKGVARIIGPKTIPLYGGAVAFWVETINEVGTIEIDIESQRFETKKLSIKVK